MAAIRKNEVTPDDLDSMMKNIGVPLSQDAIQRSLKNVAITGEHLTFLGILYLSWHACVWTFQESLKGLSTSWIIRALFYQLPTWVLLILSSIIQRRIYTVGGYVSEWYAWVCLFDGIYKISDVFQYSNYSCQSLFIFLVLWHAFFLSEDGKVNLEGFIGNLVNSGFSFLPESKNFQLNGDS